MPDAPKSVKCLSQFNSGTDRLFIVINFARDFRSFYHLEANIYSRTRWIIAHHRTLSWQLLQRMNCNAGQSAKKIIIIAPRFRRSFFNRSHYKIVLSTTWQGNTCVKLTHSYDQKSSRSSTSLIAFPHQSWDEMRERAISFNAVASDYRCERNIRVKNNRIFFKHKCVRSIYDPPINTSTI